MPLFSDLSRQPFSEIKLIVAGIDLASRKYVVYKQTNFILTGGAQPGTATVTLRDPKRELDIVEGSFVKLVVDGVTTWGGYVLTIERGFMFRNKAVRKWTLHCVDQNIYFERLYLYNHDDPRKFPTGDGRWPNGQIPVLTTDKEYLLGVIADTDLALIQPAIKTSLISETVVLVPGPTKGKILLGSGSTLRAQFDDVAGNAAPNKNPGSYVYYIDPEGFIIYNMQDDNNADFAVGEGVPGNVGISDLMITRDISTIKNDVILFTNDLSPIDPKQTKFLYRHSLNQTSINRYGRFQYSEVVSGYKAANLRERATKLLFQEGTPALRADFTLFRPGLLPGQIVTVASDTWGFEENLPIRQVEMSFPTPHQAEFHVTCSFDTQDPWGLLLALKRPPARGFVPPRFQTISLAPGQVPPPVDPYTYIREVPTALGGGKFQLSYAYIRYGLVVHVGGLRKISKDLPPASTANFYELNPDKGTFQLLDNPSAVYAEYHVAHTL